MSKYILIDTKNIDYVWEVVTTDPIRITSAPVEVSFLTDDCKEYIPNKMCLHETEVKSVSMIANEQTKKKYRNKIITGIKAIMEVLNEN